MKKAQKLRLRFLVLMILSSGGAVIFHLNLPVFLASGTLSYMVLAHIWAIIILTFLISSIGLLANLFQWISEV